MSTYPWLGRAIDPPFGWENRGFYLTKGLGKQHVLACLGVGAGTEKYRRVQCCMNKLLSILRRLRATDSISFWCALCCLWEHGEETLRQILHPRWNNTEFKLSASQFQVPDRTPDADVPSDHRSLTVVDPLCRWSIPRGKVGRISLSCPRLPASPFERVGPATKHSTAEGASPGSEVTTISCRRQGACRRRPISTGNWHRLRCDIPGNQKSLHVARVGRTGACG